MDAIKRAANKLKDKITKFEKYCMVCMIARRAYAQDTIAAIYDRDRSSISRYMSVWLSKLGEAGHDLSELDMEMNFNHMTIKDAQATGTPYMKYSESFNLLFIYVFKTKIFDCWLLC